MKEDFTMSQKEKVLPDKKENNIVSPNNGDAQVSNSVCSDCFFCEAYKFSCSGSKICGHHEPSER